MRSSDRRGYAALAALLALISWPKHASAQAAAQGFAVERFYSSAPGAGWFVLDSLDMHGKLGGAMSFTTGYSHDALRLRGDGAEPLNVVSSQAFADFGFAATYDRLRLYLNFEMPFVVSGSSGTFGGYSFAAPKVDPGSVPDAFSDARLGGDVRLLGEADAPFRLGAGAQLYFPSGLRSDYDTDHTYRAMFRVLAAGDVGAFTYAGNLGIHVRPLHDPAPESPKGSELLFGVAAGGKLAPCVCSERIVIGPEIFGATAFDSFFGTNETALEALLTTRFEGTAESGPQLRVKLGLGAGIDTHFGAPEERALISVEVFDRRAE